ncbi:molybdopterin-dependent oxidoreductase [Paramicrobacterium chengjingii]|uniref:Molybdopterin-dependent oxidoreductase n=1 Tax=Paramicrobacterium chengjingii TaxID=2769067 RepID=A0ABX6YF24_9MICO|nr:molybdopterin-dependent oxidoreductase [Microbacterium chengjingii]QPZ37338.1 molybdopterin-dependent oxidoreductase [Microbacterium chengjingii]
MTLKSKLFWSALSGIASAAAGLAIAEVIALVIAPPSSPLVAVGSLVIDLAPTWAKDFAIAVFGTNDKLFLLTLIAVLLAALAAAAGVLELIKAPWGLVVFGVIGGIATIAVTTREQSTASWAIPSVVGMMGAALMLYRIVRKLSVWTANAQTAKGKVEQRAIGVSRRDFFIYIASTAVGAAVIGVGARAVNATAMAATAVRKAIKLPAPAVAAPPIPEGAALDVEGITPLITPNADFYRIDTALQVPSVDANDWSLRVTGMVENPITITFDELLDLPLTEKNLTLMCVSNEIGGNLTGNATWLGYPIHEILKRAKPQAGADMVLSHSIDGFTAGTPLEILQEEDRDCFLAVGMNGEPLPPEHGFPVRMVVPGLYGYVSATKWVVELELTTYDRSRAYWTDRGWSAKGPVKTCSRIDVPTGLQTLDKGKVPIAGIAWAQHTGIDGVEVRVDDGEWMPARLANPISDDTWVQWVFDWDAPSGTHVIEARATDKSGTIQSGEFAPVAPNGAEGWHAIRLEVA